MPPLKYGHEALSDASDASKDVALEPPAVEAAVAKDPPDDGDQEALSSQEQAPLAAMLIAEPKNSNASCTSPCQ
eukprot:5902790-Amphidinium_carterae.1